MTKTTKKKRLNLNLREKKAYLIEATKKNREVLSLLVLERERERERFMREMVWREREGTCFGERELNGQQKLY